MAIYFYSVREQPYGAFSNFSAHGFTRGGYDWRTSEHYFQAHKFVGHPDFDEICAAPAPKIAADKGRGRHRPLRPDWNQVKDDIMRDALKAKFAAHPDLRALLLSTGTEELIEKTTGDYYWGCGTKGTGENRLGQLLMELRAELRSPSTADPTGTTTAGEAGSGMLLSLAIGDAYGAGFEYASPADVTRYNDLSGYTWHRSHTPRLGKYTDDTQMSLAIAEAIVSGEEWTPLNLANRFVACFHRDPRPGYAGRFYDFLQETTTGEQFLRTIRPDSDKSGAAMRAAPLGIYPSPEEVLERARVQARLTHDTPDGIAAAQAAALMTHYFLYEHGPRRNLGTFLEAWVPGHPWAEPWHGKVGAQGWMSVRAAVTAVMQHANLTDVLQSSIAFTGDVDTVATLALAAASCAQDIAQDLPPVLVQDLENGLYGRDYLQTLDEQLSARLSRGKDH